MREIEREIHSLVVNSCVGFIIELYSFIIVRSNSIDKKPHFESTKTNKQSNKQNARNLRVWPLLMSESELKLDSIAFARKWLLLLSSFTQSIYDNHVNMGIFQVWNKCWKLLLFLSLNEIYIRIIKTQNLLNASSSTSLWIYRWVCLIYILCIACSKLNFSFLRNRINLIKCYKHELTQSSRSNWTICYK